MPHLIHLKSTDSREATDDELKAAGIMPEQIPANPNRWKLMAHQVATIQALREGNAPIVINQAMTGDGKTLAGQFMLFNEKLHTFTMYPTNELARDQQRSLDELLNQWIPPIWGARKPLIQPIDAREMDIMQDALAASTHSKPSRMDTLERLLNSDAVLTNPDIFHLTMQFAYKNYGTARDLILGELTQRYDLFVFDEFHLFGTPQIASVMIAMLLMQLMVQDTKHLRFLFLSATKDPIFDHLVAKTELPVKTIDGNYIDGAPTETPGWRRILQPVDLTLHSGRLEDWLDAHIDDVILAFFDQQHPVAKGLVVANSVATAHRVYARLKKRCEALGIKVGINTGITPLKERGTTENYDLVVATSTVDVGVDFHINFLIFESLNAASHMQRLGRLGRHQTDRNGATFEQFEAHALLPEWVIDGLMAKFSDGKSVNRQEYYNALKEAFPPFQAFSHYHEKWSGIQAANIIAQLQKPEIKTQYATIVPVLRDRYEKLFPRFIRRYKSLGNPPQQAIFEAARSFRGSSPFTALVIDLASATKEIMAYNLITILRRGGLEAVQLEKMLAQAERGGQSRLALTRANPLAAYNLHGWLEETRQVEITLDSEILPEQMECVIEKRGVRLSVPDVPDLNRLNRRLEGQILAAIFIPHRDPDTIQRMLRLGQMELFSFSTTMGNISGTVAFAQNALLLDSIWKRQKSGTNNPIIY